MIRLRQKSVLLYLIKPFFVLVVLFGIFGIIWLRSSIISMEYSISELENKRMDKLRQAKELMAEEASLLSTQKVERTAVRDLGLVLADRTRVVYVRSEKSGPSRASLRSGSSGYQGDAGSPGKTVREAKAGEDIYGGYR